VETASLWYTSGEKRVISDSSGDLRSIRWSFRRQRISVFSLLRDDLLKVFDAVFGEGHRFVIAGVIDVSAISGNRIGASF
jgi:hypothetical protein